MKIISKTIEIIEKIASIVIPALFCIVFLIAALWFLGLFGSGILHFLGWVISGIGKFLLIGLGVFILFIILFMFFDN